MAQIEDSTIDNLVRKDISTAFGSYLGWFPLTLLFTILLASISSVMGITPHMYMVGYDSINLFVVLVLPLLFISYIQPLVQANIILSNGFKEGFKAVFTLFSINLWRSSFQLSYFKYIVSFWLTIIILLFLFSFFIGMLGTIGLSIIGNILIFILVYIFMITMAISSMMAKRLVEH